MSLIQQLPLRWNGHEQAFVHKPTGATLEGLVYAAKKAGYDWRIDYPEGRTGRRCVFVFGARSTPLRSKGR